MSALTPRHGSASPRTQEATRLVPGASPEAGVAPTGSAALGFDRPGDAPPVSFHTVALSPSSPLPQGPAAAPGHIDIPGQPNGCAKWSVRFSGACGGACLVAGATGFGATSDAVLRNVFGGTMAAGICFIGCCLVAYCRQVEDTPDGESPIRSVDVEAPTPDEFAVEVAEALSPRDGPGDRVEQASPVGDGGGPGPAGGQPNDGAEGKAEGEAHAQVDPFSLPGRKKALKEPEVFDFNPNNIPVHQSKW